MTAVDPTPRQDHCVHCADVRCADMGHSDCVRESYRFGYQAGREDAAREVNIDKIRQAARHLCARIIASAHLLDVPFTDAPDQSPWTKAKRDMAALYEAVGIRITDGVSCCTCPDVDVTAVNEKPGSRTVKGLDPACPVHGSGITEGEG